MSTRHLVFESVLIHENIGVVTFPFSALHIGFFTFIDLLDLFALTHLFSVWFEPHTSCALTISIIYNSVKVLPFRSGNFLRGYYPVDSNGSFLVLLSIIRLCSDEVFLSLLISLT